MRISAPLMTMIGLLVNVKGYSLVGVGTADFDATLSFFSTIMGLRTVVVEERGVHCPCPAAPY